MGLLDRLSFSRQGREPMFLISSNWNETHTHTHIYLLECDNKAEKQLFDENIKSRRSTDLSELVVAEVKVDKRVELGEARQLVQLVAGQAQGLDVAQTGVSSFQDPQTVIGQVHVDQIVQVLQPYDSYFSTTAGPLWHLKQQLNTVLSRSVQSN